MSHKLFNTPMVKLSQYDRDLRSVKAKKVENNLNLLI